MNILFSIFSISFVALSAMLFVKSREIRSGKNVFASIRSKSDFLVRKNLYTLKVRSQFLNIKNITTFFHSVLTLSIQAFIFLRDRAGQMRYSFLEEMKLRSVLKNSGSVSLYLKNISQHKMSQRQGPSN